MTEQDIKVNEQPLPVATIEQDENEAIEYAKGVKEFLTHLLLFVVLFLFSSIKKELMIRPIFGSC
ncbi:hypothetical protein [Kangiella sp. TOML190]|uniref:hypothetical protein n=1 Tax=Kangiella sp. TOML190 TaxID=2931351 RepID=UPI002041750E|nr:hypothetical protein [Kangiella sp. TOML190]